MSDFLVYDIRPHRTNSLLWEWHELTDYVEDDEAECPDCPSMVVAVWNVEARQWYMSKTLGFKDPSLNAACWQGIEHATAVVQSRLSRQQQQWKQDSSSSA